MSKNIIIQEGGVNKNLNAIKKIQTAEQGGGSVYWVPEEDIELGDKTIKKNGTYYAKTDSLTGYAKVYVNVPGGKSKTDSNGNLLDDDGDTVDEDGNKTKDSGKDPVKPKPSSGGDDDSEGSNPGVVGTDPDDGNEYHIKTDPTTGDLIRTKIPSSIQVTTPPSKTTYQDGDTLNPSGIIVHKYFGDGTDAGTILSSELKYDPIIVSSEGVSSESGRTSELDTGNWAKPINCLNSIDTGNIQLYPVTGTVKFIPYTTSINMVLVVGTPGSIYHYKGGSSDYDSTLNTRCTYDNKSIGWDSVSYTVAPQNPPTPFYNVAPNKCNEVAWTVIWGQASGGTTTITVKWTRPTDGKILTDTFDVTVNSDSESGGGGSHGF